MSTKVGKTGEIWKVWEIGKAGEIWKAGEIGKVWEVSSLYLGL